MRRNLCLIASLLATISMPGGALSAVPVELDRVSAACVACHADGKAALALACPVSHGQPRSTGHVVSVAYAALAQGNTGLRPVGALPPELVLFEGKLTCVTCHGVEPHDGKPLALDNRGSALCLACHPR